MFVRLRTKIITNLQSKFNAKITSVQEKFQFPEKYKGTVWEKWFRYWQQLSVDYKEVGVGVVKQIREKPIRSAIYGAVGASLYYAHQTNPSETDFQQLLRDFNSELVLVNENSLNLKTQKHFRTIEQFMNEGRLRYLNLGILSMFWIDNYDPKLGLYEANCSYTQPELRTFHERIVDVGFLNKWWTLTKEMENFDVVDE